MSVILIYMLVARPRGAVGDRELAGRPRTGSELAARDAQLRRLREEVDGLHAEVRRLADEHSFMVRLLTEGDRPRRDLPPPEHSPDPDPNPEKP
jgi:hypothetical protein